MEDRPLRQVLAYAMPVECGLAADMQAVEALLQQGKARVQVRRIVWPTIDAARQSLQPAGTDIVDGEIGRYPQGGEILGSQRRSRREAGIKSI
jgi:hypothetical protein